MEKFNVEGYSNKSNAKRAVAKFLGANAQEGKDFEFDTTGPKVKVRVLGQTATEAVAEAAEEIMVGRATRPAFADLLEKKVLSHMRPAMERDVKAAVAEGTREAVAAANKADKPSREGVYGGYSIDKNRAEANGIKRPSKGTLCAAVWEATEANLKQSVGDIKAVAEAKGWNTNNAVIEFYRCRKFHGIVGRAKGE